MTLYSNPTTSTPVLLASVNHTPEVMGQAAGTSIVHKPIAPINLTKDTDYMVALYASWTGTLRLENFTLGDPSHRALWPGGTSLRKGSRQNLAGAFGVDTITLYRMGVMISHVEAADVAPTYAVGI
jgi:hypothetical protein